MSIIKKKIITSTIIICVFLLLSSCNSPSLVILEEESYFNDYSINNDEVRLYCYVTIKNNTNDTIHFELEGDFSEDVEGGLLKERYLLANLFQYDEDKEIIISEDNEITISANTTEGFEVVFVGEKGNNEYKQNRLMPKMKLLIAGNV